MSNLTFKGRGEPFTVTLNKVGNPTGADNGKLSCSIDGGETWTKYTAGTTISAKADQTIQFAGSCSTFSQDINNYYKFDLTSNSGVDCEGSINSLIGDSTTAPDGAFINLFNGCTNLYSSPDLRDITTLAPSCYYAMFTGCTNLVLPSHLPATVMKPACYYAMFWGCSNLITTPAIYITETAANCCQCMFQGCSKLTVTMDSLPAADIALSDWCFHQMFLGCTSLQTPPKLPATTLAEHCYRGMFQNCISLTSAPALPAKVLQRACYCRMFYNCRQLTAAPELNARELVQECYQQMFWNCQKLSSITVAFTAWDPTTVDTYDWVSGVAYKGVFEKPASLKKINSVHHIPNMWKKVVYNVPLTFEAVGGDCKLKLKKSGEPQEIKIEYRQANTTEEIVNSAWTPLKINRTYTVGAPYQVTVKDPITDEDKTVLRGGKFFQVRGRNNTFNTEKNVNFYRFETEGSEGTFALSGNLLSLITSDDLTDANQFARLFEGANISNIDNLVFPNGTLTKNCFFRMFADCEDLEYINEENGELLPAPAMAAGCYASMFQGCKNLRNMPALPATKLAKGCYKRMFKDCEDLDVVPELNANKLEADCYNEMFYGCTKVNSIKCSFDDWNNYHATDLWLTNTKDCTIFIKDSKLTEKYSANNIPENSHIIPQDDED